MKVGVVGAGSWGANIVRTLHGLDALHSVADLSEANLAKVRGFAPDVHVTTSVDDLLESDAPAIAIATPGPAHFEVARRALDAGKDVFVEKPLTLSVRDGEVLVAQAERLGRVLMVGHLLMYQPAIDFIKRATGEGQVGEILSLHFERLNLGRARPAENVLWSIGVHDVAIALYLLDAAPDAVSAHGQAALQQGIEDDLYLHMRFSGGRHAHLHCSWLWPEKRRRLTVVGSTGMLVYDENQQQVWLHRKGIDGELNNVNQGEELLFEGAGEPLRIEMEHFMHCIRHRARPKSDGLSAIEVLRVMESAGHQA